jgi:hypothetical protein
MGRPSNDASHSGRRTNASPENRGRSRQESDKPADSNSGDLGAEVWSQKARRSARRGWEEKKRRRQWDDAD